MIPQKIRKALGIDANRPLNVVMRDNGIYISPIREVISDVAEENSYHKILEKTRGAWRGDKSWEKVQKQRRKVELEAARRNKRAW